MNRGGKSTLVYLRWNLGFISKCLGVYSSSGNWAPISTSLAQQPACHAGFLYLKVGAGTSKRVSVLFIQFFSTGNMFCKQLFFFLTSAVLSAMAKSYNPAFNFIGCFVSIRVVGWFLCPCFILLDFFKGVHIWVFCIVAWWLPMVRLLYGSDGRCWAMSFEGSHTYKFSPEFPSYITLCFFSSYRNGAVLSQINRLAE